MLDKKKILEMAFIYTTIKVTGTLFALYVFNRFTPLIDSTNYINNYYVADHNLRTQLIQSVTTFLTSIFGTLLTHISFSLFSSIGILIYCFRQRTKSYWLLSLLFIPSAFIWTSIVGKEAIYFGAMSLFIVAWMELIKDKIQPSTVIVLTISILIMLILRPHYSIAALWLILSASILKKELHYYPYLMATLFTIVLLSLLSFIYPDLIGRGYGGIDASARASRFKSLNIESIADFKSYLLMGSVFGIIGPLPTEILNRYEFIPFFLEGLGILTFPFAIAFYIKKKYSPPSGNIYWLNLLYGIFPAILLLLLTHAPFGVLNPGSAIRWRVNFELIFYFAPILLLLELRKK